MSLAALRKISEEGVEFRSHLDGSKHLLTPERSIDIQRLLGADITMAFDECTPYPAERAAVEASMELSMRWAERSRRRLCRAAGARDFRHRPGRRARRFARALRAPADRNRLRWLCDRRAGGRRRTGDDLRDDRGHRAVPARGPAALPDGGRQAGRSGRRRQARHRHVRLRAADPLGPNRAGLHPHRHAQSAQRPPCRRSCAARYRMPVSDLHRVQPRLSSSPCQSRRNSCGDATDDPQFDLLRRSDDGDAGGDHARAVGGISRRRHEPVSAPDRADPTGSAHPAARLARQGQARMRAEPASGPCSMRCGSPAPNSPRCAR